MYFIYDVCVHDDGNYREQSGVEFSNPIHIGEFINSGKGETEYEVFRVVHSGFGGGSAIHVRPPKEI